MKKIKIRRIKPIVAFSGSCIQQNFGESLHGHGWLKWNVKKRTFKFNELYNKFGYYTLRIGEDKKIPDHSDMPDCVRLRLFVPPSMDITEITKVRAVLRKKHNIQEMIINRTAMGGVATSNVNILPNIDVHNVQYQNELIENFLSVHFPNIDAEGLSKIYDINAKLNDKLVDDEFAKNICWRPKKLTFSNMFCYGEDNYINFENLKGLYGLFAPNVSGKTSAFDVMMFCLYDKTPRAFKASHIMNNRKDDFECQLNFEIENVDYFIRRVASRNKKGDVKVDVTFWQLDESGNEVSLNGEDRRDTDALIRSYVGSYDDFILTNLSVQNQGTLFIDKSQSERKDLLTQFMGLTIFDKLYTLALDEMKEVSGALKRFNREDFSQRLAITQKEIEELRKKYTISDDELQEKKRESGDLAKKITKLYADKVPLDIDSINITKLESQSENLLEEAVKAKESASSKITKKIAVKSEFKDLEALLNQFDPELEVKYNTMVKVRDLSRNLQNRWNTDAGNIGATKDRLLKLSNHKYNETCDMCMLNLVTDNEEVRQWKEALIKQEEKLKRLGSELNVMRIEVAGLPALEADFERLRRTKEAHSKLDRDLLKMEAEIQYAMRSQTTKETELEQVRARIQKYYDSIEVIKKNETIQKQISKFEDSQRVLLSEIKSLDKSVRQIHGELEVRKSSKQEVLQSIKEAEELEETYYAYEYYTNAICRDGVPYELIARVIPNIEAEINNILTQIVDFTIVLEVDGKNINGKLVYDVDKVWPLELSSGMERFISSLAIRVALVNISNLPKSSFLVVDEGLGALDADNLSSMHTMFSILKAHFDFIIVVSHLEVVKDIVDNLIEIKQDSGFSAIHVD